ncbi:MAG: hypothetical protein AAFY60_09925 [Myxococcota bacterium]
MRRILALLLAIVTVAPLSCASAPRASAPRPPLIELSTLRRAVDVDGIRYVAAYVSLEDFVEFAQSRPDLTVNEKSEVRLRAPEIFAELLDPARFITAQPSVPDWVLAGSGAFQTANDEKIFLGVGNVSKHNDSPDALAQNLARAQLSSMLQRIWDRIIPPSDLLNRPSWVAEVPMEVGDAPP